MRSSWPLLLLLSLPLPGWAGELVLVRAGLEESEAQALAQVLSSHLTGLDTRVSSQQGPAPAHPLVLAQELGAESLLWCEEREGRVVVHLAHVATSQHLVRELDTQGQGAAGRHAAVATVVRSWVEVLDLVPVAPEPEPRRPEVWVGLGGRLRPLGEAAPLAQELDLELGLGLGGPWSLSVDWLYRPGISVEQEPARLDLGIHALGLGLVRRGTWGPLHPWSCLAVAGTLWRHQTEVDEVRWESDPGASQGGLEVELTGGLGIPLGARLRLRPEVGVAAVLVGHSYEIHFGGQDQSLLRPWLLQPLVGLVLEGR